MWVGGVMVFTMLATRLGAAETRVRVGRQCVMLGEELHSWSLAGSWLQGAEMQQQD